MSMEEVATIGFIDVDTGDEAAAIVRTRPGVVGLSLALRSNGDLDVFLGAEDCQALVEALTKAVKRIAADAATRKGQ